MTFNIAIKELILKTNLRADINEVNIVAPDCWQVDINFSLPDGQYRLRNLQAEDEPVMREFGNGLGEISRDMFGPYPWTDPVACAISFNSAISNSIKHIDASYILEHNGTPIGHFFLWKAGGNPLSAKYDIEVPELGVAIVDSHQGRGFGGLAVRFLQLVAKSLDADAVELTTAQTNSAGWQTYQHAGFEYVGILRIPLGVDVTDAELGEVTANNFRDERQMVYIINPQKDTEIYRFLAEKRGE